MDKKEQGQLKEYLLYANALLESMESSIRADPGNVWKYASYKQYICKYNQLITEVAKTIPIGTIVDAYDLERIPGASNTIAMQQKELFESVHANLSVLKAYLEHKLDLKADEITNLINFFQTNLRRAVFETPKRELEIQDVVEQLLIGRGLVKGIDYDRETGRVKVSIKEVVPDFILPKLSLALEVKLSKDATRSRTIVDEINADIMAYSKQYTALLFIIYDLGSIRDEVEFKQDLELTDGVSVIVVKH
jgi:hypothetical protein